MTVIWKYELDPRRPLTRMPRGARILTAAGQHDDIVVWARVDPGQTFVHRALFVIPTGNEVPEGVEYVGTALIHSGDLVFHIFDGGEQL